MAKMPVFDPSMLQGFYAHDFEIDLSWMKKPTQHQFRWRCLEDRWQSSHRRVRNSTTLVKAFRNSTPTDVYVSTASWLNPIELPRLRDLEAAYPILLDHLVVFDIDVPPFCIANMELARQSAIDLYEWMKDKEEYAFSHVAFSGSKGFHLFYQDLAREKFQIPDPKEREEKVRSERKKLLDLVTSAGHTVDTKITADTRRIIRLPGTIHGRTGWKCSIVGIDTMYEPFKKWYKTLERHSNAVKIPRKPSKSKKINTHSKEKGIILNPQVDNLSIEVSTHVAGTKNRSSLLCWLPDSWGDPQQAILRALKFIETFHFGATAFWTDGHRTLMMVPRAIPREQLIKITRKLKMNTLHRELKERQHSWVRISGKFSDENDWERELMPINVLGKEFNSACTWPWSRSHLELSKRMGLSIECTEGELSGNEEPSIRIAQRA